MINRRLCLRTAGAFTMLGLALQAGAKPAAESITVYKNPACGCCGEWIKHIEANGFRADVHQVDDVSPIRRRYGVPDALASCHTAIVSGYAIEGHVPADDIKRLLRERLMVKGLAVPGMVPGSPGMVQGAPQRYATLAFDDRGAKVFAQH
jgi:hypothetical protein